MQLSSGGFCRYDYRSTSGNIAHYGQVKNSSITLVCRDMFSSIVTFWGVILLVVMVVVVIDCVLLIMHNHCTS